MALSEAVLAKNLDEIESELELLSNTEEPHPRLQHVTSIRSKISFVKSLLAAECGGRTTDRLNCYVAQLSALESAFDEARDEEEVVDQPKMTNAMDGTGSISVRRRLEELEAMVHSMPLEPLPPFWSPNTEKIRSMIRFTKSHLSAEDKDEQFASMAARLAAVEEAHARRAESPPLSCSCTSSCYTEDVEVEEEEVAGDGGFLRKSDSLRSNLVAAPMELQGCNDYKEENIKGQLQDADANGGNESSSCACTSSCFEEEDEGDNKEEVEEYSASGVNETGLCSMVPNEEEVERNSEAFVSLQETREEGNGSRKRSKFGKLPAMAAMVGVFCVAVTGIVLQNFFSKEQRVYLVPT